MIDIVLPENRFEHAATLMQMHQDRKRVFVDILGWDLPAPGCWLEMDEFDDEFAVYLLARSATTNRHTGSVRLLQTTRRHMLGGLFAELCAGKVPTGEDCWEISRLVAPPAAVTGTSIVRVHRLLALGLVEFAALNSISRYSLVIEPERLPALLSIGWEVHPLGLPRLCMGQMLQAVQINVSARTVHALRARLRIEGSVLRSPCATRVAA